MGLSPRGARVAQGRLPGTMPMLGPTAWAEAPVYGWDTLVLLRHLLEQGLSKTAIAVDGLSFARNSTPRLLDG